MGWESIALAASTPSADRHEAIHGTPHAVCRRMRDTRACAGLASAFPLAPRGIRPHAGQPHVPAVSSAQPAAGHVRGLRPDQLSVWPLRACPAAVTPSVPGAAEWSNRSAETPPAQARKATTLPAAERPTSLAASAKAQARKATTPHASVPVPEQPKMAWGVHSPHTRAAAPHAHAASPHPSPTHRAAPGVATTTTHRNPSACAERAGGHRPCLRTWAHACSGECPPHSPITRI